MKNLIKYYEDIFELKLKNSEGLFFNLDPTFLYGITKYKKKTMNYAVDLGYGAGLYTRYLAKNLFNVIAFDVIDRKLFFDNYPVEKDNEKITIIKNDIRCIESYDISTDIVVCKDVLHYLDKKSINSLMSYLENNTNNGGIHYFKVFTDINRVDSNNNNIYFESEAQFKSIDLINHILNLYGSNWEILVFANEYEEFNNKNHKYFSATQVSWVAKKYN